MFTKRSKICALKMILGPDVLVLSTFKSSNNPIVVNYQGKSKLESESYILFSPHVFEAMNFITWLDFTISVRHGASS